MANVAGSVLKAPLGFLYRVFSFLFTRWHLALAAIVFVSVVVLGAKDSIQERSFVPFVVQVGGRTVNFDNTIGTEVDRLAENPSIVYPTSPQRTWWDKIKFRFSKWGSHFRIITALLFGLGILLVFYFAFRAVDDRILINLATAVLIILLLQMTYNLLALYHRRAGSFPSTQQFFSAVLQPSYIIGLLLVVVVLYALYFYTDTSKMANVPYYVGVLSLFVFIFVGFFAAVLASGLVSASDAFAEVWPPFPGTTKMVKNMDLVLGRGYDRFSGYLPEPQPILSNVTNESIPRGVSV